MQHYSTNDVVELLAWPESRVRAFVADELIHPQRVGRGYQFGFQDLVTLRAADDLLRQGVAPRQVKAGLRQLKHLLPDGKPLSAMRLAAAGNRLVVRDGSMLWEPLSGQGQLDFDREQLVLPVNRLRPRTPEKISEGGDSDDWYNQGVDCEERDEMKAAEAAYRRAVNVDDRHADAHINLGRLLQQRQELAQAEDHYRRALDLSADHPVAHFNLGTLFEETNRQQAAIGHYHRAAVALPDAHYNLARIFERLGDRQAVIRHLRELKMLRE